MKKYFVILLVFLISCSSNEEVRENPQKNQPQKQETDSEPESEEASYKIIFTEEIGWGYQIFQGATLVVNQTHIPAIQGMKGFETKEKATIAADYILQKINQGIFPPTITAIELDSLGVLESKKATY